MTTIATGFLLLYAILVSLGGILGFVKAKSYVSLVSGLISGVALGLAWYISLQSLATGLAIATAIALVLLGVFAVRFHRTRSFMPAGLMAALSFVASVLFLAAWLSR